jgi:hypothetical protein
MLSTEANTRLYTYTKYADTIHEFQFRVSSPTAIDAWLTSLETLQSQNRHHPTCLLLDLSQSGILPMTYTAQQARRLLAQYTELGPIRVAVLHKTDFPVELVKAFTRVMYLKIKMEIRYFPVEERQRALAWLRDK